MVQDGELRRLASQNGPSLVRTKNLEDCVKDCRLPMANPDTRALPSGPELGSRVAFWRLQRLGLVDGLAKSTAAPSPWGREGTFLRPHDGVRDNAILAIDEDFLNSATIPLPLPVGIVPASGNQDLYLAPICIRRAIVGRG